MTEKNFEGNWGIGDNNTRLLTAIIISLKKTEANNKEC
jgi:hypothetical protein